MGKLKLVLNGAAKRFAGTTRRLRSVASRRPTNKSNAKNAGSGQVSVSTSSSGPSIAGANAPAVQQEDGEFLSPGDPRPAPQPSPDDSLRLASVHIDSTVAEEIAESPLESGAEVLLTVKKAKRAAGLRRAWKLAVSKVSSRRGPYREILPKSLAPTTPSQGEVKVTDHQEKKDIDATSSEEFDQGERTHPRNAVDGIGELSSPTGGDVKSMDLDPTSVGATIIDCGSPLSMEIDVALIANSGLRPDDALNDTMTLADSLTSDEEDSVNSDPFSKLSDSPNDLPVSALDLKESSGSLNVEMLEPTNFPRAFDDEDPAPESQAAAKIVAVPTDEVGKGVTRHVSFLNEFRKRHERKTLPTVQEDKDLVGSEINLVRSNDEAESFHRTSSALSTASSILVDDGSDRLLRRRKSRYHDTSCADNCDCLGLGSGNCEDRSVELSNGSSILSDDSEYEYSEASVPTCYICLQASEARGSLWQDLK